MTITCKYSCELCGLERRAVEVPARTTEDVRVWMESICIPALVRDHEAQSPGCRPRELKELLIPIGGADIIGGPAVN